MAITKRLGALDRDALYDLDTLSKDQLNYHTQEAARQASEILRRAGSAAFAVLVARELKKLADAAAEAEHSKRAPKQQEAPTANPFALLGRDDPDSPDRY